MSDTPRADPSWIATIKRDSAALAAVAEDHGDAAIEHCPGWDMIELVHHMGSVQRWATAILTTGELAPPPERQELPTGSAAAEYLRDSTSRLLEAIAEVNQSDPAWNFTSAPQVKEFWLRRQANEIAVHRWDGEHAATGDPTPLRPEVAADVIDEYVTRLVDRVIDREGLSLDGIEGDVHLHCIDVAGEWTFEAIDGLFVVTAEHRKSAVAARGTAHDLALLLYGRTDQSNLEIFGEPAVLQQWLDLFAF